MWTDLEITKHTADLLYAVAAVREYFAGYRKSKSLAKAGVTGMTHKRRATGSSAHEFDIGAEGIGGLDFQLGSMLQMGGLSAGGAMVLPDGFDLDLMMGNGSTMPHFNLVQPQPPMPGLLMSQIHHTAALTQQNTLDAITHQLNVLKNAKPALLSADSAMEDMKPHERAKVNVAALSREELEERVVFLEEQLERKERESLELEEALAKATNTSTVDLREAVSALKSMNAVR